MQRIVASGIMRSCRKRFERIRDERAERRPLPQADPRKSHVRAVGDREPDDAAPATGGDSLPVEMVAAGTGGEGVVQRGAGGRRAPRDAAFQPGPQWAVGDDEYLNRTGA